jgi:prevent-host-death family protein
MEEIAISKFKATCLAVLEKVKKTGQPILVTRFGHPVAQITPPAPAKRAPKFGTGANAAEILGDIVGPITDLSDWDAWSNPDKET